MHDQQVASIQLRSATSAQSEKMHQNCLVLACNSIIQHTTQHWRRQCSYLFMACAILIQWRRLNGGVSGTRSTNDILIEHQIKEISVRTFCFLSWKKKQLYKCVDFHWGILGRKPVRSFPCCLIIVLFGFVVWLLCVSKI